jgi:hypothetical protein
LLPLWEISDGQPDVVNVIELWQQVGRFLQCDADLPWLAGQLLYRLVHAVQYSPCEVSLGVGQSLGVIGSGSFD